MPITVKKLTVFSDISHLAYARQTIARPARPQEPTPEGTGYTAPPGARSSSSVGGLVAPLEGFRLVEIGDIHNVDVGFLGHPVRGYSFKRRLTLGDDEVAVGQSGDNDLWQLLARSWSLSFVLWFVGGLRGAGNRPLAVADHVLATASASRIKRQIT